MENNGTHNGARAPIDPEFLKKMNGLAGVIDQIFNGHRRGSSREVGFVLLVFPFNVPANVNYIANSERVHTAVLLRELLKRWEAQSAAPEEEEQKVEWPCSHCGHELTGEAGVRHFGTHAAHPGSRCLELLKMDIAELKRQKS